MANKKHSDEKLPVKKAAAKKAAPKKAAPKKAAAKKAAPRVKAAPAKKASQFAADPVDSDQDGAVEVPAPLEAVGQVIRVNEVAKTGLRARMAKWFTKR